MTRELDEKDIKSRNRFWKKVLKSSGCWQWIGAKTPQGYGSFWTGKFNSLAHRVAWKLMVGLIPDNMTIDHLCRNKLCINPNHLEVVTLRENILRGDNACSNNYKKTHCSKGHPLVAGIRPQKTEHRGCPICIKEKSQEWKINHRKHLHEYDKKYRANHPR